jgi:hypothetical protein
MAPKTIPPLDESVQDSLREEIRKSDRVIEQSRRELEERTAERVVHITRDPANTPPFDGRAPTPEHGAPLIPGDPASIPRK